MNCSPTGNEDGLVGYWDFEEEVVKQYWIYLQMEIMVLLMVLHIVRMFLNKIVQIVVMLKK